MAVGYLYDSIVYDMAARIAKTWNEVSHFVLRRADVPPQFKRDSPALGQNGFYYSESGEVTVRGDGTDLAEFDSMLFDRRGGVLCLEAKASANNLEGLPKSIRHRKHVLSLLFRRDPEFLIVSPVEISSLPVGRLLEKEERCLFARTHSLEETLRKLSPREVMMYHPRRANAWKGIGARQIPVTKTFSFRKVYDRSYAALAAILPTRPAREQIQRALADPLLPRMVVGVADERALDKLLETTKLTVEGRQVDPAIARGRDLRTVLVLGLPELRPGLYFRSAQPEAYVKFGPFSRNEFGCEAVIFPGTTPFFYYLEMNRDVLDEATLTRVIESCLTLGVIGPHVHKRRMEEERVVRGLFNMPWNVMRLDRRGER